MPAHSLLVIAGNMAATTHYPAWLRTQATSLATTQTQSTTGAETSSRTIRAPWSLPRTIVGLVARSLYILDCRPRRRILLGSTCTSLFTCHLNKHNIQSVNILTFKILFICPFFSKSMSSVIFCIKSLRKKKGKEKKRKTRRGLFSVRWHHMTSRGIRQQ